MVENKPGVLAKVSGLFSGRGFNIESLTVGETEDITVSRMTIVVSGDDIIIEQVNKQLNKLVDTIKVIDLTKEKFIERGMALLKVSADAKTRPEIMQIVELFRSKIVDIGAKTLIIEVTGPEEKISALIDLLKPFGIKEMVRTGSIALPRAGKN